MRIITCSLTVIHVIPLYTDFVSVFALNSKIFIFIDTFIDTFSVFGALLCYPSFPSTLSSTLSVFFCNFVTLLSVNSSLRSRASFTNFIISYCETGRMKISYHRRSTALKSFFVKSVSGTEALLHGRMGQHKPRE